MSIGGFEDEVECFNRELFEAFQGSPAFCSRGTLTLCFRRQLKVTDLQDRSLSSSLDIEQAQNAQDEREAELMISVTTANKDKVVSEITLLVSPGQQEGVDNYTKDLFDVRFDSG